MRLSPRLLPLWLLLAMAGCSVFEQDFSGDSPNASATANSTLQAKEVFLIEAEAGQVIAKGDNTWELASDENASGSMIVRKVGGVFYPESNQGPAISWSHTSTMKGTYDVWIRVKPNATGDSLFFAWEGNSSEHHWPADTLDTWVWSKLRTVELGAGQEIEFALWAREDRIEVDALVIQSAGAAEPKIPERTVQLDKLEL